LKFRDNDLPQPLPYGYLWLAKEGNNGSLIGKFADESAGYFKNLTSYG
jgi:hypothetical protein|tara:strand:- start:4454 stop:4597 length:144 start_codon:yes stop_codon:yes gene_type:complete